MRASSAAAYVLVPLILFMVCPFQGVLGGQLHILNGATGFMTLQLNNWQNLLVATRLSRLALVG